MIRLVHERRARGWSQAEVARRTGFHPTTISHLEAGHLRLRPGYKEKLCLLFHLPPEELFREEDESDVA
jgi:transcriptional regulator with XRE-family HTH domain